MITAIQHIHQDNEEKEVVKQEFDAVTSKIFNVHSIWTVIIAKLKTQRCQRADTCEYKIDTGSDGNLKPTRMYKTLFLDTNINELNTFMKNIVLHDCNNLCIPQMGTKITMIDVVIEYQWYFFVLPGNGPVLLGIPD